MALITISAACDAIATTLATVTALDRVQSYDELTDDFPDCPMAQVYPVQGGTDQTQDNDRQTFGAGSRISTTDYNVDIPVSQASELKEDMSLVIDVIEAVETKLREQRTRPYFGAAGIQSFRWDWERTDFIRGGADFQFRYPGVRFRIKVWRY